MDKPDIPNDSYAYATDCTWFLASARGKRAHEYLVPLCREMEVKQSTLRTNTKLCQAVFQWGGDARNLEPEDHAPINETANVFNAAQNGVETVHAKVMKSRISLMPLTNGGRFLARKRAKDLGKAIEGILEENEFDAIEEDVLMDALTTDHGAGAVKVFETRDNRIKIEHALVEDVLFDEVETRHRKPSCCYHAPSGGLDVFKAIELYAKDGDEYPGFVGTPEERREGILKAAANPEAWRANSSSTTKMRVDIFEAWHLPSGECESEEYDDEETGERRTRVKHDGRHVVAVAGCTLIDEPWEEDWFPIILYVPRKRRRSIWGLSLMRDWIPNQREYETLTKKIQHQHQKMGISGFAAAKEAGLNVREITSGTFGAGFVVETEQGMPITQLVVEPVAQGTYAYAEQIPRSMLERKGVSTLAASSQLPAGLQQASGKALQVFEDFEDVRLLPYHRERERWKIAVAWVVVQTAKRIVNREGGSLKTRYPEKHGFAPLDWADLKDLINDRDSFVLRVFPISSLSKHPAARFAQLTELLNAQAITVEQFKRLFDLPDLEAENELDSADTDIIDRNLDVIVTKGKYLAPQPFDNLDTLIERAGKFYNLCRVSEVPEDRLELIRNLIEDAKSLKKQALDEAAANAPPPPMDPNAPPPDGMGPEGMPPPEEMMPPMDGAPPTPAAA